jgi:peptidoglycan/LPS O-acetylase OafA/YrhL
MLFVNNLLLPWAIAPVYYGLIYERTWLRKILATKLSGLLGRSSYALYLLHWPVIFYVGSPLLKRGYFAGHHNFYVLCTLLVCVLLSILIYLFYEEPMRRRIRKWAKVRESVAAGLQC